MLSLLLTTTTLAALGAQPKVAIGAQAMPVPPVVVSPPMPPPPPPPSSPRMSSAAMPPPIEVEVEVRGGQQVLWQGRLRVATGRSATVRYEISQPAAADCPPPSNYSGNQNSLNLTLGRTYGADPADRVNVMARWQRPASESCDLRGSRTVELSEMAVLNGGEWSTVAGDGGLVVRLRRR